MRQLPDSHFLRVALVGPELGERKHKHWEWKPHAAEDVKGGRKKEQDIELEGGAKGGERYKKYRSQSRSAKMKEAYTIIVKICHVERSIYNYLVTLGGEKN